MANALSVRVEKKDGGVWVELVGDITEDSDFSPIIKEKPTALAIDLAGVKRINSTGVREWINFIAALQKDGTKLVFERCSVAVVQQLNMIANFAGRAEIRSVFAPYVCPSCDREDTRLIDFNSTPTPNLEEEMICSNCQSKMEFDDLADSYLSFRKA